MKARGPNKRKPVTEAAGTRPATSAADDVMYRTPAATTHEPAKRWYTTREAAEYLECGKSTLEKYRAQGTGPAYHQSHGERSTIQYAREDLDAWHAAFLPRVETAHSRQIDDANGGGHG